MATPDRGSWIVVRAEAWAQLDLVEPAGLYTRAKLARFVVEESGQEDIGALEQTLRERVRSFAEKLPGGDEILALSERMTALELADATIANLPCSVQEKATYASETSLSARLRQVIALLANGA